MSDKTMFMLSDFSGGMNTVMAPHEIADNEAVQITNFDLDFRGKLVKRLGTQYYAFSGGNTYNILPTYVNESTKALYKGEHGSLLISYDYSLYKYDFSSSITNLYTYTIGSARKFLEYTAAGTKYYYAINNLAAPVKWDGSAASFVAVPGTPPNAYDSVEFQNRLWLLSSADYKTLYFSPLQNDNVWTTYIQLEKQAIDLIPVRDKIYCFGGKNIQVVYGSSALSFGSRVLFTDFGGFGAKVWRGNIILFIGSDYEIYEWDGVNLPRRISVKYKTNNEIVDAVTAICGNKYLISLKSSSSSTYRDKQIVVHLDIRDENGIPAFSERDYGFDVIVDELESETRKKPYFQNSQNFYATLNDAKSLLILGIGTTDADGAGNNDADITFEYQSKNYDLGSIANDKTIYRRWLCGNGADFPVTLKTTAIKYDGTTEDDTSSFDLASGGIEINESHLDDDITGRFFNFNITGGSGNADEELYTIMYEVDGEEA